MAAARSLESAATDTPATASGTVSRSSSARMRRSHVVRLAVGLAAPIVRVHVAPFASASVNVIARVCEPRSASASHTPPSSAFAVNSSRAGSVTT